MQASRIGEEDMLSQLKQRHFGLRAFFATFPDIFHCEFTEDGDGAISATDGEGGPQPKGEFFVSLVDAPADEYVPARHPTHAVALTRAENVPVGHATHVAAAVAPLASRVARARLPDDARLQLPRQAPR